MDLPPGVGITGSERSGDGPGFEVRWPLPEPCRCERCGQEGWAHIEFETTPQAVRGRDLRGPPGFGIDQAPFHRGARRDYRPHLIPPFERTDVASPDRSEPFLLRSRIGSTAEGVARRRGISAETVERIVEGQLAEDRRSDPKRVITDIGLDELGLKERPRLDVTSLTDLSDPTPASPGPGAGHGHGRRPEVPGSPRGGAPPAGPDPPGGPGGGLPGGVGRSAEAQPRRDRPVPRGQEVQRGGRGAAKQLTRESKAKLTQAERKAFRSQRWAFRRDPTSLTAAAPQALEGLFEKIPAPRALYRVRLRFREIFDTAPNRTPAARWLRRLRDETERLGLDLSPFFETYDRGKAAIRNDFDAHQTSAAVAGVNHKARPITRRAYGLKSAKSLWDRLILDLNRASEAIGGSIEQIRPMAQGLTALSDPSRT